MRLGVLLLTSAWPHLALGIGAQEPAPPQTQIAAPEEWETSFSLFYSDPPGSEGRVMPILYADRGSLHLEARYQYEDLDTVSFFAGRNFAFGEGGGADVEVGLTPMLGAAVGSTDGIVPALEFDLGWKRIEWYAESEYLFDLGDRDDDFFYSWSTLTYEVADWLKAGIVIERSKVVDTDFDVQRGLALQYRRGNFGASVYAYNLGTDDSYATFAVDLSP